MFKVVLISLKTPKSVLLTVIPASNILVILDNPECVIVSVELIPVFKVLSITVKLLFIVSNLLNILLLFTANTAVFCAVVFVLSLILLKLSSLLSIVSSLLCVIVSIELIPVFNVEFMVVKLLLTVSSLLCVIVSIELIPEFNVEFMVVKLLLTVSSLLCVKSVNTDILFKVVDTDSLYLKSANACVNVQSIPELLVNVNLANTPCFLNSNNIIPLLAL